MGSTTAWDVLSAARKYDGSPTAHKDTIGTLKAHGHSISSTDAWCTEQYMAVMYDAGGIDLVGGYAADSGTLKKHAQKKGIWHNGSSGILPFDVVLFGRSGKTNHTEMAIGHNLDLSGNYNGGTSRRSRTSHSSSVVGYIRPKLAAMPEMDNLQLAVVASDVYLGVYGTGDTRKKQLSVWGADNVKAIQAEVDRVYGDTDDTVFIMAVSAIAGFLGTNAYRAKRLGNWSSRVQKKINAIYALRGKSIDEAAQLVLEDAFGKNAVRKLLLEWCGYDADRVQARVNELLNSAKANESAVVDGSVVSLFRGISRPSKDVDGLQGDCVIVRSGGDALIMDTMRAGAIEKITNEIKGCMNVSLYFSHEHSDHMSTNANKLIKSGLIKTCYVPAAGTISTDKKYQSRYKQLLKDCAANGVQVIELKQGSKFAVGAIKAEVLFQQASDSINMHSLCTLFTIGTVTYLTCGDHHCGEPESKFKAPGKVTIYKGSHHQLYTGDDEEFIKEISPDWIIGSGWQSWPNATVGQDPKTKRAQANYQAVGNLLPGDVCGRTEYMISGGVVTAKGDKNMVGKTVKYSLNGKTYQKTVHVCSKTTFHKVASMIPRGAVFV